MDKNQKINEAAVRESIETKLANYYGVTPAEATEEQVYGATLMSVKDALSMKKAAFHEAVKKNSPKKVYYMCMEFLIGRQLRNNIMNLGLEKQYRSVLKKLGFDIDSIYELEPDPALGNGGLGRLAACFMDGLTSQDYYATGFSICYEYGLFKQRIVDGDQVELPDDWMREGGQWLVARPDKAFNVRLGGEVKESWDNGHCDVIYQDCETVRAVPYDLYISGADCKAVNTLRLWKAVDTSNFNMSLFSQGEYERAIQEHSNAEVISKVLYPSDNHEGGKLLRLSQQYFLVSASVQSIISDHLARYGTLSNFAEKVAIHINDTHPALVIPELMRILLDIYSYSWEDAWSLVTKVVSYTNHTVMPEALEKWDETLFRIKLPRIYMIVCEINRRMTADLWNLYPGDWNRISRMSVIAYNQVRMANLSVWGSHTVNGVSALHSDILTKTVFHDYYQITPRKFTNVTNGIAMRRWLCAANPGLTKLLDETIGKTYRKDFTKLSKFAQYQDDKEIHERLAKIKHDNKEVFAKFYHDRTGKNIDTSSVFDVQVKRMHEYKRQTLNLLKILTLYNEIKNNPNGNYTPTTFIFSGKAAPGYWRAKEIIKLIWCLGEEIEKDPAVRDIIRVVYAEDYNVTVAENLIPSADISEQISLAGKEASGTGCMKFMLNGALTIGTLDGANVEMREAMGADNFFLFGLRTNEVEDLWKSGYNAQNYYRQNKSLRDAIDTLGGRLGGHNFSGMADYFLNGTHGVADPYMCLADYESYMNEYRRMIDVYHNQDEWLKKSVINIASSGFFSADRSIKEYADKIWHSKPID